MLGFLGDAIVALLLFATIGCWLWAVVGLGRAFRAKVKGLPGAGRA